MSALGQKRPWPALFDHLIGRVALRNCDAKRFGRFEIDDKFEFGQPFDRQVAWLDTPEGTTNGSNVSRVRRRWRLDELWQ
jgi:hypothetical protein